MSKIICDVCGTSYPETATQCPICGCVRHGDVRAVAGDTNETETQSNGTYIYVKGGRFSKSNVKKRNHTKQNFAVESAVQPEEPEQEKGKKDKGLIIAVFALLLAIVAVVIYIALHFFAPGLSNGGSDKDGTTGNTNGNTSASTTDDTQDTSEATIAEIPCIDMVLSNTVIEFDKADAAQLLDVTTDPVDTTDVVLFSSSDESVATVTADGKITAVGGGQAIITVACGEVTAECRVVCSFEDESTDSTETPTIPADDFKLNREDFTLSKKGSTWTLYTGDIPADQITWTSDDESVATIKDGVVTAVGSGYTTVYGEYQGVKLSCIVRCAESVGKANEGIAGSGDISESGGSANGGYSISHVDVSIKVDEKFSLELKDANGIAVSVNWTVADGSVCSVSGNVVTGLTAGTTTVSVTHEDVTYSCIVRVY